MNKDLQRRMDAQVKPIIRTSHTRKLLVHRRSMKMRLFSAKDKAKKLGKSLFDRFINIPWDVA